MKRRPGQAAGRTGRIFGEALHQIGRIALLLLVLAMALLGLLAFRLSQGPMELPQLASRLATAVSGQGIYVHVARAELAWAGYKKGGSVPFYLRLGGIEVHNGAGLLLATIPSAHMVVPPADFFGAHEPVRVDGDSAGFTGVQAPISWHAQLWPGPGFTFAHGAFFATLGPGSIGQGVNKIAITGGGFEMHGSPGAVDVTRGMLALAPQGASAPHLGFGFTARDDTNWHGTLTITGDKVHAPDLAAYWPPILLPHTRHWALRNITAGTARDARFTFNLVAPEDLDHVTLENVSGYFSGTDITLTWLPGAAPLTDLTGSFAMPDKRKILITTSTGRIGHVALTHGALTITGLVEKKEVGDLSLGLAGTLPDALAILGAPPLNLLRHAPASLAQATGVATAELTAQIPFHKHVTLAETHLRVTAQLHNAAMMSPLPPLAFTQGEGTLHVADEALKLAVNAKLGDAPVRLDMDESGGTQTITLAGTAGPQAWQTLGVSEMSGTVPFKLNILGHAGDGTATLTADLTPASLSLARLAWTKPAGVAGQLTMNATLTNGAFHALTSLSAKAPGLAVQAQAQGGRIVISHLRIGRTQASGTLTPPAQPGAPWALNLSGKSLDLRRGHALASVASSPPWSAHLHFDQLYLAASPAPLLANFSFTGSGQGAIVRQATGQAQGLNFSISPRPDLRHNLTLHAGDTGLLLRALAVYKGMEGGQLSLHAVYGGGTAATGLAVLTKARMANAPGATKILQALTLYGMAAAVSGPGLLIDHAVIPFTLQGNTLEIKSARAYSPSLGFTVSGRVQLDGTDCALDATIVPAYALNALLGKIPLVGKLFSAEKGGGLIAVRAHISGPLLDPRVRINPLSALTPGFLRDIFGLGGT